MKLSTRTAAVTAATLGLSVAGIPLALGAFAAPGHVEVGICHATSSDSNPYVWIVVDEDSVKYEGHLAHKTDPNKTWQNAGVWNGIEHAAGAAKADIIGGDITEAWCESAGATDPETEDPGTEDPGTEDPGTENPGTEDPGTENPGTEDPGTENPGTEEPGTENPGTEEPGTETPAETPATGGTKSEVTTPSNASIPTTGGTPTTLAHTGSSSQGMLAGIGAGLLIAGATFVMVGRRPEQV